MLKRTLCALTLAAALQAAGLAGVVIEMVDKDLPNGNPSAANKIYAQGTMLRVVPHDSSLGPEVIFRDGTIFVVNHEQHNYFRMDEATMAQVGSAMDAATRQMREQLKNLPEGQRAEALEMIKRMGGGKLPPGMGQQEPPLRVEPAGSDRVGSYACKTYAVYRGTEKQMEICSAADAGAAAEAMPAFREMSKFFEKMLESFKSGPLAQMAESPYQLIDQIGGIPVRVRHFENGRAVRETTMDSAQSQSLDDDSFRPPSDYELVDPFKRMPGR